MPSHSLPGEGVLPPPCILPTQDTCSPGAHRFRKGKELATLTLAGLQSGPICTLLRFYWTLLQSRIFKTDAYLQ